MDMYLREAIMKYLETQKVNDVVLATAEKRKNFSRFCDTLILKDNKLLCKGRSGIEPKVIPTPQQVNDCLFRRHVGPLGRHVTDRQTLVKAISDAGYGYLVSIGGLAALVDELVKNQEWCKMHVRFHKKFNVHDHLQVSPDLSNLFHFRGRKT